MNRSPSVPRNLDGGLLSKADYEALKTRWINEQSADAAFLRRVDSLAAAEALGLSRVSGDYSGVLIPYIWPGEDYVREVRLRRDHPEIEIQSDGTSKSRRRYVSPQGRSNMLYFAPGTEVRLLQMIELPVVIVEGEFKTIALWRLAWYGRGDAAEEPMFLPMGLPGVWNWRGRIGKQFNETGTRVDELGPIPDLDKIDWKDRHIVILYDTNVATNPSVAAARSQFTEELTSRGARVHWFVWPEKLPDAVNGIDDYLATVGPDDALEGLVKAKPRYKKLKRASATNTTPVNENGCDLIFTARGDLRRILANALVLLQNSAEWKSVLAYNEFAMRIVAQRPTPWGTKPDIWTPLDDSRAEEWLQRNGLYVGLDLTAQAVEHVARLNGFHPVREYLDRLAWDGKTRLETWLSDYIGVEDTKYVRQVGAKWLISGVARIYSPGCKVDTCLILEGPQGTLKSTALRTVGDPWFTDEISDLGSKDSSMQVSGVWLIELGELDSIFRPEMSKVKAFMSRCTDRYRPPYGKRLIEARRQCIFAGTVNQDTYLRDETGARRFWPVTCGPIRIDALATDRDQLWAEARKRFQAGEKWWLTDPEVTRLAIEEQRGRYQPDPWQERIEEFARDCIDNSNLLTVASVLSNLTIETARQSQSEANRVARCLQTAGYRRKQVRDGSGEKVWVYQMIKA